MTLLLSILIVLVGCVAGAYGGIMLKKGSSRFRLSIKGTLKNKSLVIGVLVYGLGTITYIIALRGAELSIIYPLVSTTYIWIAVLSQKMLGEKMNTLKWAGISLILVGVSLIGMGAGR
jgi:uncharacterized membrane protein